MKQDRPNNYLLMLCHKSITDTLDTVLTTGPHTPPLEEEEVITNDFFSLWIPHNKLCLHKLIIVFKCSWEDCILPGAFENKNLCKMWGWGGGLKEGIYGACENSQNLFQFRV